MEIIHNQWEFSVSHFFYKNSDVFHKLGRRNSPFFFHQKFDSVNPVSYILTMGYTKRNYEQMTMEELLKLYPGREEGDEDYQYELYRERQLEMEREAYEQHLSDKH